MMRHSWQVHQTQESRVTASVMIDSLNLDFPFQTLKEMRRVTDSPEEMSRKVTETEAHRKLAGLIFT